MWTIVQVNDLVWVMLWDGEVWFGLYWSLEEATERLVSWYHGH